MLQNITVREVFLFYYESEYIDDNGESHLNYNVFLMETKGGDKDI